MDLASSPSGGHDGDGEMGPIPEEEEPRLLFEATEEMFQLTNADSQLLSWKKYSRKEGVTLVDSRRSNPCLSVWYKSYRYH
jgi:hypothetical protein